MDISSININSDINKIYNFMADIDQINLWSFGIHWDLSSYHNGIVKGVSNFNQSVSYLKITKNDKTQKINYWIGKDSENLIPRIYVRIISTDNENVNELSMIALKTDDMTNEQWEHLKILHVSEINIIKGLIEKL